MSIAAAAVWVMTAALSGVLAAGNGVVFHDVRHLSRPADAAARAAAWQQLHALVCLQGMVNHGGPRLAIRFMTNKQWAAERGYDDLDGWWLHKLRQEKLLPLTYQVGVRNVDGRKVSVAVLARQFRKDIKGLVVWDPRVSATSHLATTLAGVMDLLPVTPPGTPGSLHAELTAAGFDVAVDLAAMSFADTSRVPDCQAKSTGSAKCNVYAWMIDKLIVTGKVDARYLGYYVDGVGMADTSSELHTTGLVNCDYLVQRRGVLFDLSVWGDEPSCDEPNQPAGVELATLRRLLEACQKQRPGTILKVHGFAPWPFKYTIHNKRGKHDPVPTEWESIKVFSEHGVTTAESDAADLGDMPNGSFYCHASPKGSTHLNDDQNRPPPLGATEKKVYICWWMGDYDSSAWMYSVGPAMFADPARGTLPLAWGINPTVFERSPHIGLWLQHVRRPKDYFVAYEGPGYIDANYAPDLTALAAFGREQYARYNLTITGQVITSQFWLKPEAAAAYATFSPDGVAIHPPGHHTGRRELVNNMPIVHIAFHVGPFETDANRIADLVRRYHKPPPDFMTIRCILVTPTTVKQTMDLLGAEFEAVDPYTFFRMVRRELAGKGEGSAEK